MQCVFKVRANHWFIGETSTQCGGGKKCMRCLSSGIKLVAHSKEICMCTSFILTVNFFLNASHILLRINHCEYSLFGKAYEI